MINMKKLQLRNVFGKVEKLELYGQDDSKGGSSKVVNMGPYGDYFFLGQYNFDDNLLQYDWVDDEGFIKPGTVITESSEMLEKYLHTDIDMAYSSISNIQNIVDDKAVLEGNKYLQEYIDSVEDSTWSQNFKTQAEEYLNVHCASTYTCKSSCLDHRDSIITSHTTVRSLDNGSRQIPIICCRIYDVEYKVIVTSWSVDGGGPNITSSHYQAYPKEFTFEIKILKTYLPKPNTVYYFPKHDVELTFKPIDIHDRRFNFQTYSGYDVDKSTFICTTKVVRKHVTEIVNSHRLDDYDYGYPQKVNEVLCFTYYPWNGIPINIMLLQLLPFGNDIELVGNVHYLNSTTEGFRFNTEYDDDFQYDTNAFPATYEADHKYEYHVSNASKMINIIEIKHG